MSLTCLGAAWCHKQGIVQLLMKVSQTTLPVATQAFALKLLALLAASDNGFTISLQLKVCNVILNFKLTQFFFLIMCFANVVYLKYNIVFVDSLLCVHYVLV